MKFLLEHAKFIKINLIRTIRYLLQRTKIMAEDLEILQKFLPEVKKKFHYFIHFSNFSLFNHFFNHFIIFSDIVSISVIQSFFYHYSQKKSEIYEIFIRIKFIKILQFRQNNCQFHKKMLHQKIFLEKNECLEKLRFS